MLDEMIGQTGDVDQSVQALLQLYESTEIGEADDLALNERTDRVLLLGVVPRIGLRKLSRQADLAGLGIKGLDHDLDLLSDGEQLIGVADRAPAHLGNVKHSVDAAEIYERAVAHQSLDRALHAGSDFDLGKSLFSSRVPLVEANAPAIAHDAVAAALQTDDAEGDLLSFKSLGIDLVNIQQGSRNEYTVILIRGNNAIVHRLGHGAGKNLMILISLFQFEISLILQISLVADKNVGIADLGNNDRNLVSDLNGLFQVNSGIRGILIFIHRSICFVADIQSNLVVCYLYDNSLHDVSRMNLWMQIFQILLQHFSKVLTHNIYDLL